MKKVLIAEDNPVNRELLRELLETSGYEVSEACNGEEAIALIAERRPHILLLDLGMPVLDGYATIRRIRADQKLAGLSVIAVTAYAMRGDRERILKSGFDGYVSKPISPLSLQQALDRFSAGAAEFDEIEHL